MIEVRRTAEFADWLDGLRDRKARARIVSRIDRIAVTGLLGDVKRFDGLLEIRCDFGPGYRLYSVERADGSIIILLCGGDKSSQRRDIARAKAMTESL